MFKLNKPLKFFIILIISILSYFIPLPVPHEARVVFSILVFSALLWITETIPLFLTALLSTILLVLFKVFTFPEAVSTFANPIIVLFFGGFLIARAMQVVNIDVYVAEFLLSRFKNNKLVLLSLMFVTAFLSMWISNTATTLVMIPIALGVVLKFGKRLTNFSKAMVLGIAFSANIGGIGTIIGSPPNAITVASLFDLSNITVSFLDWFLATIPVLIVLIPICWLILLWVFPFKTAISKKLKKTIVSFHNRQKLFAAVFFATVLLWLTTGLHGISSSLIALISVTAFFLVGLLKKDDLNAVNYNILILFGGGLVLGAAMFEVGLSQFFADGLASVLSGAPSLIVIFGIILFAIVLGALASNTATAAILVPVLIPLASVLNFSPRMLAMVAGVAVSLDFLLPVGTAPNAIAYSTGKIKVVDMLKAGIVITLVSVVVLGLYSYFFWQ